MAYKVIRGKNKIRGEQTFVDNISGSVISASSYVGGTFSGSSVTATTISASSYLGISVGGLPGGTNTTIQFNSGSALSGSSNFTFDYVTNTVYLTGTLRADTLIVSSSQILKSGSTIFGDDVNDTHQFTGSILAGIVSGTNATFNTFTGSLFGTASFSSLAATASFYNTSSLLITASVSNATVTFTKGDNSTFPITINNVVNAQTASVLTGFNQNNYLLTSSFNTFTASYNTGSFSGSFTGSLFGTASFATTASFANSATVFPFSGSAVITGSLTLTGSSGTTIFSTSADTIIFTGSLFATGSIILTGTLNVSGSITGNLFGTSSFATTASFATNCLTASFIDGGFY